MIIRRSPLLVSQRAPEASLKSALEGEAAARVATRRATCAALAVLLAASLPFSAAAKSSGSKSPAATPIIVNVGDGSKKDEKAEKATATKPKLTVSDAVSSVSDLLRSSDGKASTSPSPGSSQRTLVVTVVGELRERGDNISLFSTGSNLSKSLKGYLDLLRKAREDKDVKTVVIRFSSSGLSLSTAQEFRAAIEELRDRGKKTVALVEDDAQAAYLAASACEEVVIPPSGELNLYGVRADQYYLRGLLEKVGVQADVVHMGQYKSFGETFTQDRATTPARENMEEMVNDAFEQYVDAVAKSRKIDAAKARTFFDHGPFGAEDAKKEKLVDRLAYSDEILAEQRASTTVVDASDYLKGDKNDKLDEVSVFSLISMLNKQHSSSSDSSGKYPQVAVLYAVGEITQGSSGGKFSLSSEDAIASDDMIEVLEDIRTEKKIKAVILRINSPGGSAFASDLIWRKIQELRKEKPVIASMGEVAASGGYYMAMGADRIVADEGTITGSIGVVGGKPDLSGAYAKLGINKESVSRGKFSGLFSETSRFSGPERQVVEELMKRTYDDFVSKAAQGRKLPKAKLYELAQGKVWSGARARQVGLIDEVGGFGRAILEAKALIGLKKDDKVSLVSYPKELGIFDVLQRAFGGASTSAQVRSAAMPVELQAAWTSMPSGLRKAITHALMIGKMFQSESVLAVAPMVPELK